MSMQISRLPQSSTMLDKARQHSTRNMTIRTTSWQYFWSPKTNISDSNMAKDILSPEGIRGETKILLEREFPSRDNLGSKYCRSNVHAEAITSYLDNDLYVNVKQANISRLFKPSKYRFNASEEASILRICYHRMVEYSHVSRHFKHARSSTIISTKRMAWSNRLKATTWRTLCDGVPVLAVATKNVL